jgi:hypothetical protein
MPDIPQEELGKNNNNRPVRNGPFVRLGMIVAGEFQGGFACLMAHQLL